MNKKNNPGATGQSNNNFVKFDQRMESTTEALICLNLDRAVTSSNAGGHPKEFNCLTYSEILARFIPTITSSIMDEITKQIEYLEAEKSKKRDSYVEHFIAHFKIQLYESRLTKILQPTTENCEVDEQTRSKFVEGTLAYFKNLGKEIEAFLEKKEIDISTIPVGGLIAHFADFNEIMRGDLLNVALEADGKEKAYKKYVPLASLESLHVKVANLERGLQDLSTKVDTLDVISNELIKSITRVELTSFTADFRNESLKLKVLPPYQEKWKKMSDDKKREELEKTMRDCYTDPPAVDYRFISPAKGKSWTKVSFPSIEDRNNFESHCRGRRNGKDRCFTTHRLVPQSFLPVQQRLVQYAQNKVADDWNKFIKSKEWKKNWRRVTENEIFIRVDYRVEPKLEISLSADLGGSSKYSREALEDRCGE